MDVPVWEGCPRSFVFSLPCFEFLLLHHFIHSLVVREGRDAKLGRMLFESLFMVVCILGVVMALVLILNNLWSVIGKYRIRKRDRMWFNALFTEDVYAVMDTIILHSHDLSYWVRGFGKTDVCDSEKVIDVSMLVSYLNLLETCSMLGKSDEIFKKMFWADLEDYLWDILQCPELRSYISLNPGWFSLRMKLAEVEQKRRD